MLAFCRARVSKAKPKIPKKPRAKASLLAFCRAGVSKTKSKIPKKPRAKASLLAFCRAGVSKAKPKIPKKPRAKASLLAFCRAGVSKTKSKIPKKPRAKASLLAFCRAGVSKAKPKIPKKPRAKASLLAFCRAGVGLKIRKAGHGSGRSSILPGRSIRDNYPGRSGTQGKLADESAVQVRSLRRRGLSQRTTAPCRAGIRSAGPACYPRVAGGQPYTSQWIVSFTEAKSSASHNAPQTMRRIGTASPPGR